MNKKLYNLMDWAAIEEIVYGESVHPEEILGVHTRGKNSLVQAFFPGAEKVTLKLAETKSIGLKDVKEVKMEEADEAGFFATLIPGTVKAGYTYQVSYPDKKKAVEYKELYSGAHVLTEEESDAVVAGAEYKLYKKLGSHIMTINKVSGCGFAVYAPNALRVSVVGDFNDWNPLSHQMMAIGNTGIFELFVPDLTVGTNYKYQILVKGFEKVTKCDPFAMTVAGDNSYNSVVTDLKGFTWQDGDFIYNRKTYNPDKSAVNIYELNIGSYLKGKGYDNVKKMTKDLVAHLKKMSYTHVEFMPFMEFYDDTCAGFYTTGYFAPTYRYGSYKDYMHLINELHKAGIGVIMQWTPAYFDNSEMSFAMFDGTSLYENGDYRKGIDTRTGKYIFDYGNPYVMEFLISSANFWISQYHIDAIKFNDVTSMLYLDYYREDGNWVPNIYGGNENLEAINFIKLCNKVIHDRKEGVFTIADEKSGFAGTTFTKDMDEAEKENCLGFDLTINSGFNSDVFDYISLDPILRSTHHDCVTLGSVYQYREKFMFSVSHEDTDFSKGGLINRMPGIEHDKYANLKALYGYMYLNPGKKEILMGQEYADPNAFNCEYEYNDSYEDDSPNGVFAHYMLELNKLYKETSALYELDNDVKGFEWINNLAANENIISFIRKGKGKDDIVVCLINFANCYYDKYKIGVPVKGKYVEIFNSDREEFGGSGLSNMKSILSRKDKWDERPESIRVKLAPLSVTVLKFTPLSEKDLAEISKRDELKEKKREAREKEKAAILKEREKQRKALLRERAKIKDSLKNDLVKKIEEAEKWRP